jgi:hypothetical protein
MGRPSGAASNLLLTALVALLMENPSFGARWGRTYLDPSNYFAESLGYY